MMLNEFEAVNDPDRSDSLIKRIPEMAVSPEACAADAKALQTSSLSGRLHELSLPTLVIHSGGDFTATQADSKHLLDSIDGALGYYLEQGTHISVIGDYQRVAKAISNFI